MSKQQSYSEFNGYRFHQGVMGKAEPGEVWDVNLLQEVDFRLSTTAGGAGEVEAWREGGGSEESASSQTTHISPSRWDCQEAADGEAGSSRLHSWHLLRGPESGRRGKRGAQETQSNLLPPAP